MRPSRRPCLYASLVLPALALLAPRTHAETLTITSSPPGATLEIDGKVVGTTPYEVTYPGGFFHKTHTVFGERLKHAMTAHISKDGYASQRLTLTTGPFEWTSVTGRHHGNFFLLRSERFEIKLKPDAHSSDNDLDLPGKAGPIHPVRAAAMAQAEPPAAAESSTVEIESEPSRADIYIDWKFAGQTPSTLHLACGAHHVELKASGRQNWERELQLSKDSRVTLHPVLEPQP
jgi:hypothetical protein